MKIEDFKTLLSPLSRKDYEDVLRLFVEEDHIDVYDVTNTLIDRRYADFSKMDNLDMGWKIDVEYNKKGVYSIKSGLVSLPLLFDIELEDNPKYNHALMNDNSIAFFNEDYKDGHIYFFKDVKEVDVGTVFKCRQPKMTERSVMFLDENTKRWLYPSGFKIPYCEMTDFTQLGFDIAMFTIAVDAELIKVVINPDLMDPPKGIVIYKGPATMDVSIICDNRIVEIREKDSRPRLFMWDGLEIWHDL